MIEVSWARPDRVIDFVHVSSATLENPRLRQINAAGIYIEIRFDQIRSK